MGGRARNPFVPTFGTNPYILVGREEILMDVEDAFEQGVGAPGLTMLITGQRGTGKTVLLNEYQRIAAGQGWAVIAESSSGGLLDRLVRDHLPRLLAQQAGGTRLRSGGVTAFGFGVTAAVADRYPAESTLRSQVTELTGILARHGGGLVITVDEIDAADPVELRKIGEVLQHARRENRPLGFAGAGLSVKVDHFLNQPGTTFLRRAERYTLGRVPLPGVAGALATTVTDAGRTIDPAALGEATRATAGYPFLIQLIGHQAWRQHPDRRRITLEDVRAAARRAPLRMGTQVHAPALLPLSAVDKSYLLAMSIDTGDSRTGQIAARLGVTAQYASVYRARLLEAGVIEEAGYGLVRYAIPYLGEYLRHHIAANALEDLQPPGPPPARARHLARRDDQPTRPSTG